MKVDTSDTADALPPVDVLMKMYFKRPYLNPRSARRSGGCGAGRVGEGERGRGRTVAICVVLLRAEIRRNETLRNLSRGNP
jgi:hypothetical protein